MEIQIVVIAAEVIAGVLLALLYVKSRIPKQTIEQQTQLIVALKDRVETLEKAHTTNQKAIGTLEGQIKVYKELPLQEISKSLQVLETLPTDIQRMHQESNKELIEFLRGNKLTPLAA